MNKQQFDRQLRLRAETERMTMTKNSEERLARLLTRPQAARPRRRGSLRTALLTILVLALLCGAALAAVTWNSRQLLTYTDGDGNTTVNDDLVAHIQPVDQRFVGEVLAVEVVDAIFDGNALVLAWTNTNSADAEVYILCDVQVGGSWPGAGSRTNVDEVFIAPGQTIDSGMVARTDEGGLAAVPDACEVTLTFTAFTAKGEVVGLEPLDGENTQAEYEAYMDWIDAQVAQGNVVLAQDGVIELGRNAPMGKTRAEALAASGLMEQVDSLTASFTVTRSAQVRSALPGGRPIEKDNGGYTLRVVRADLTPATATFELERVFKSEAAAQAYAAYYAEKLGPFWGFSFLDETGDVYWAASSGGGASTEAPVGQADGTWVWGYHAEATEIVRPPKSITIVPMRDNPDTGAYEPFMDEAIVLDFE